MTFCYFNPLHAKSYIRLTDIVDLLKGYDVIVLVGTHVESEFVDGGQEHFRRLLLCSTL